MAGKMHIFLPVGQLLSGSDPDLLLYQINAGHPFGYRVLYLDPGIHFHKIKIPVLFQQKFDRPRIFIMRSLCRFYGCLPHLFPQIFIKRRRRRFLDHFLVISLDGAVTLS